MGKNKMKPKPVVREPMPEAELVSEFSGQETQEESPVESEEMARRRVRKAKVRAAMDGTVFLDRGMRKYGSLIVYVFVLALLVITNNYLSEKIIRESTQLKSELKELQYRQISAKAEWMRLSRQSSVARMLDTAGIKESVVPPFKIKEPVKEKRRWWSSGKESAPED